MTIQKFEIGNVVTVVTNHYDNDRREYYQDYDFAQIIGIADNSYVLDIQAEAIEDKCVNITVDMNTLQLSKTLARDFSEYLDGENLIDHIDNLSVYHSKLIENFSEKKKVITKTLHDIFSYYKKNTKPKSLLDISNTKDRIFLMFNDLLPKEEETTNLDRIISNLYYVAYYTNKKGDYQDDVNRYYNFALQICNDLGTKDKYSNFTL